MWETIAELVKFWNLSPVATMGWALALGSGTGLVLVYRAREQARITTHTETQQWLKEDTEAKLAAVQASVKVATSLQQLDGNLGRVEQRLADLEKAQTAVERSLAVLEARIGTH